MAARTKLARAALLGVAASMLLAGCSGFSSAATGDATSTTAKPTKTSPASTTKPPVKSPPPPPQTGACRSLTYGDISRFSNDTPTTPCRKPHTSYTFEVRQLPRDIAFAGVEIGNDAVQNAAAAACRTSFTRFIGGDDAARALARLTVTYFVARQPKFDRGAHWVRCDVVALQFGSALAPLPRSVRRVLDRPDALARFGVCSQGEPGTPSVQLVMCSEAHAFRALAALRLGSGGARYPGPKVAREGGQQRCKDLVDQLLGSSRGYTYTWTYPSPDDWRAGQRFGYCWQKTRS